MSLAIPVLAPDSSQPTEAVQSAFATFAYLFGAGFAIQLRRAERRGAPFVTLYLRRLAALFVFGFTAHALFGFKPVYVGAVLLLVAWRPTWQRYLTPMAWAGQMALTNYFLQIIAVDVALSATASASRISRSPRSRTAR